MSLQYMFCRNRRSHCKSLTFYRILAQPMLHFCSIPKWTYQETFRFCFFFFFFLPLEVTVSANLLVGRHQSFVLQNTNLLLRCSCKEWSALLMQSRCQINAWREACTMAPVVKLVGGALRVFIGSMRWNTGKVWLFSLRCDVKNFTCSVFRSHCVDE